MNYENMTKGELIDYIEELKAKRAFTYEDQMKLLILDSSPFTVWASDRNCKIRLWMGQCETLYGFSSKEAIGKDYVDLFVAEDEKVAARRDQIDIIDNEAVFHNIANDVGKNGNTLQLVTNCRRIKDPISGEYWNAEMGLVISYLDQEKDRLRAIINESQRIKSCVTQFIEDTKQVKERFLNRKNSINRAIRECEQKATALRRRNEFRSSISNIRTKLNELSEKIDGVYGTYVSQMQSCASSYDRCEEIRQSFVREYEMISDTLEDMALDVFDISCDYDIEQNLVSDKDTMMKDVASQFRSISELVHDFIRRIENEIVDYKNRVSDNPNTESGPFKLFMDIKQDVLKLKAEIEKGENELSTQILSATSKADLQKIKPEEKVRYLRQQMTELENRINGV